MTLRQLTKYLCAFLIDQPEELHYSFDEHINEIKCDGIIKSGSRDSSNINLSHELHKSGNESNSPRKIHFVPNIEKIVLLIEEKSILADFTNIESTVDPPSRLNSALNTCLEKLKEETTALSSTVFFFFTESNVF